METKTKLEMYKTARARIGSAYFKAGDFVSVKYYSQGLNGTHWFIANNVVAYPQHHLTDFVL